MRSTPNPRALRIALVLAAAGGVLGLAACNRAAETKPPAAETYEQPQAALAQDVHSYARPEIARVTHVDLDLKADFATKTLSGTATLDVKAAPGAREIVLDARGLTIRAVRADGQPTTFALGANDPIKGAPLTIQLPEGAKKIAIDYTTAPDAAALQWLSPEQTAGKKHPYLFSQGQAILTRTWVPTQDSPGIRQTWTAKITVPAPLKAVMSAEMLTPNGEDAGNGMRSFRFREDKPVPPYLIAIGVGDLAFKALGPRTGVYTEPSMLEAAASELVDVEKMVEAAEKLYGPYRWGRYDLLVLPPSFPFGGMENPRLTFATPTILAGDRSLVSLVAHELAHSWSGNLVTNATWDDFWLNEGFTTYFENRIMEALYGKDRAAMLQSLGWRDLQATIAESEPRDTHLHLALAGRDPDDGMSDVAYEKGAAFLRHIERTVGRERFDAWLRSYFDRHAFKPMTTELFLQDIRANLIKGDTALEQKLMLDQWINQPGIPAGVVAPASAAFTAVEAQARAFAGGTTAAQLKTQGWSTQEWQHFIGALPKTLTKAQLDDLERTFRWNAAGNTEIRFAWLMLAIDNRYDAAVPSVEQFLTAQGRRKFVLPLFTALMKEGEWGQPIARRIYAKARPGYHPVTTGSVDEVVK
ncbi:MAG TPA: M1 family metallopeptidase [Caulobacteraceae bacterium]|nr:M1 family metallopeptidase [Caulobacteraceae bacterium]